MCSAIQARTGLKAGLRFSEEAWAERGAAVAATAAIAEPLVYGFATIGVETDTAEGAEAFFKVEFEGELGVEVEGEE
jgi:hypothetical protein